MFWGRGPRTGLEITTGTEMSLLIAGSSEEGNFTGERAPAAREMPQGMKPWLLEQPQPKAKEQQKQAHDTPHPLNELYVSLH